MGVRPLHTHTHMHARTHIHTLAAHKGVLMLGDAQSFFELASKIPPLGSMLNFDADVKRTTTRHQRENRLVCAVIMEFCQRH